MHTWQSEEDREQLPAWTSDLKKYGLFFSEPLDLDLAMLSAFPEAYAAIVPKGGGPKMAIEKAADVVLGTGGPGLAIYTGPYMTNQPYFPDYRYHFLTHSKPATHLDALTHIKASTLKADMPAVLREVLTHIANSTKQD